MSCVIDNIPGGMISNVIAQDKMFVYLPPLNKTDPWCFILALIALPSDVFMLTKRIQDKYVYWFEAYWTAAFSFLA